MKVLNFPECEFNMQRVGETAYIFDPIRKKYVALTPEEWVRQHLLHFLIEDRKCPPALMAVEVGFVYNKMPRRADVIVYDRKGKPLLVGECKAPDLAIRQAAFDQIARYNSVIGGRYLVVTNGLVHYCFQVDRLTHTYHFLDDLPYYDDLTS
jgi:hypothetical protein